MYNKIHQNKGYMIHGYGTLSGNTFNHIKNKTEGIMTTVTFPLFNIIIDNYHNNERIGLLNKKEENAEFFEFYL